MEEDLSIVLLDPNISEMFPTILRFPACRFCRPVPEYVSDDACLILVLVASQCLLLAPCYVREPEGLARTTYRPTAGLQVPSP